MGAGGREGFEMFKRLSGVTTHACRYRLEIVENTQDIAAMARAIAPRFLAAEQPIRHAFLIRRHGLYTWGKDLDEARRHVEIFEFLFECVARKMILTGELKSHGVV